MDSDLFDDVVDLPLASAECVHDVPPGRISQSQEWVYMH
jgi:hypothetical protein